MRPAQTPYEILSQEQAAAFLEEGYVVVRRAFRPETAEQLLPHVWARTHEDPEDRATWKQPDAQIEEVITEGPVAELFTPRFCGSVDDLVGKGRWTTRRGFGWVILRLPGFYQLPWRPPASGWHVDGMDFQHHLTSHEIGLVGIEMLTDIISGGGGTAVRVGSHKVISRLLNESEPAGVSYTELRRIAEGIQHLPAVEVSGQAGDVLWMHPHLVHARSPNVRDTIRVAANRSIVLRERMNLKRERGADYSLVERAIILALNEGC